LHLFVIVQPLTTDPGGHGWCPPDVRRNFLFCKKTGFGTNWPTPRVVQMQKKLSASKASTLTP